MKNRFILMLAAMLLALLPVAAFAQTGVTLQTGFQVQNLGTGTANISITYYNADGTLASGAGVVNPQVDTIPAGQSKTYFQSTITGAPAGFKGSVVISSDQQIAAIGNILGASAPASAAGILQYGGSYSGFNAGATTANLPLIQRGNFGFDTFVAVQNAGTADATVTVDYKPAAGAPGSAASESATIKPGAAKIFDQNATAAGAPALGTTFVGSAKVTSTNGQAIVATASQVGTGSIKTMLTYDGFGAGAPSILMPLIQGNNFGFSSALGIQNIGTVDTTITVKYSANVAIAQTLPLCGALADATVAIKAGESANVFNSKGLLGNGTQTPGSFADGCAYVGAATITSSPSTNLVGVANQLKTTGIANGSAYEGFSSTSGTKNLSAPLLFANNAGFFTGFQIQNTGTTPTSITLTYGANTATGTPTPCTAPPAAVTKTIPPGASDTFLTTTGLSAPGCKYIGSGTVTSTTENIIGIVNELQQPTLGDQFLTYNAFNT
jgi:hypothetical protein